MASHGWQSGNRAAWLWMFFLTLLLGGSWYKAAENQRDIDAQREYEQRISRLEAENTAEYLRLTEIIESATDNPSARTTLERDLNGGKRFETTPDGDYQTIHWQHPVYGAQWELTFSGNRLVGWGTEQGQALVAAANPRPPLLSRLSRAESIRRALRPMAVTLWLIALPIAIVSRKHAWRAAQAMLALALVYGAATVLSPMYTLTLQGIFSNDPMFWAVIMYAVSLAAIAKFAPPTQPKMQFTLRRLLVIVTIVALLLAMGPIGYFALVVFAAGGLFLLTLLFTRPSRRPS